MVQKPLVELSAMTTKKEINNILSTLEKIENRLESFECTSLQRGKRLDSKLDEVLKELDQVRDSQSLLSCKYDNLMLEFEKNKKQLTIVQQNNKNLTNKIDDLKSKLKQSEMSINNLEQYSRRECLEINGVPEKPNENTDDIVIAVAKKVGLAISSKDISVSHRVGRLQNNSSKRRHPTIIAKFSTRKTRDLVYDRRWKLTHKRKQQQEFQKDTDDTNNPCTSQHAEINDTSTSTPIYINESLTKQNKNIFFLCRKFKKEHKWKYAWTRNGVSYLKEDDDSDSIKIQSKDDLKSRDGVLEDRF